MSSDLNSYYRTLATLRALSQDRTRVKHERGLFSRTTTIERTPGLFSSTPRAKTVRHRNILGGYTEVSGECFSCHGTGVFRTGATCRKCSGSGRYERRYYKDNSRPDIGPLFRLVTGTSPSPYPRHRLQTGMWGYKG